jgi:hypothetical protein
MRLVCFISVRYCREKHLIENVPGVLYMCYISLKKTSHMMPSMDGCQDGWIEKVSRPRHPLLYVIYRWK